MLFTTSRLQENVKTFFLKTEYLESLQELCNEKILKLCNV